MYFKNFLSAAATASVVSAHTLMTNFYINGVDQVTIDTCNSLFHMLIYPLGTGYRCPHES
jgi:hypothetical protein